MVVFPQKCSINGYVVSPQIWELTRQTSLEIEITKIPTFYYDDVWKEPPNNCLEFFADRAVDQKINGAKMNNVLEKIEKTGMAALNICLVH